jgi:release factor glutamine methyltransferase
MSSAAKETWTILEVLRWTTDHFQEKGVSEPRTSAEVLLAHVLNVSRLDLYLRYEQPLTPQELARFKALVQRRRRGEPVAYLTGRKEFWSLDFQVTPAVLIPRPETEILVQTALEAAKEYLEEAIAAKRHPKNAPFLGLEVGVGSGAVVVALARELPDSRWLALDLSAEALDLARDNARRHGVANRILFLQSDLLSAVKPQARFSLLVANLPYIPQAQWERLPRDIRDFEPREALLGGRNGLALLQPLAEQAHQYLEDGAWLALEVGEGQAPRLVELLQQTGAYDRLEKVKDYSGIERVVRGRRSGAA